MRCLPTQLEAAHEPAPGRLPDHDLPLPPGRRTTLMLTYNEEQRMIQNAKNQFPATFSLRAWPGRTFRIGRYSYVSNRRGIDVVMLYTDIRNADGTWSDGFAKATISELKAEVR